MLSKSPSKVEEGGCGFEFPKTRKSRFWFVALKKISSVWVILLSGFFVKAVAGSFWDKIGTNHKWNGKKTRRLTFLGGWANQEQNGSIQLNATSGEVSSGLSGKKNVWGKALDFCWFDT